jgi:hypothetical protein
MSASGCAVSLTSFTQDPAKRAHRNFKFSGHNCCVDDLAETATERGVATLLAGFDEAGSLQPALDLTEGSRPRPPQPRSRSSGHRAAVLLVVARSAVPGLPSGWRDPLFGASSAESVGESAGGSSREDRQLLANGCVPRESRLATRAVSFGASLLLLCRSRQARVRSRCMGSSSSVSSHPPSEVRTGHSFSSGPALLAGGGRFPTGSMVIAERTAPDWPTHPQIPPKT